MAVVTTIVKEARASRDTYLPPHDCRASSRGQSRSECESRASIGKLCQPVARVVVRDVRNTPAIHDFTTGRNWVDAVSRLSGGTFYGGLQDGNGARVQVVLQTKFSEDCLGLGREFVP